MHTFVCNVGLPYRPIIVCDNGIICVYIITIYACINVLYEIDVLSIPTWGQ